MPKRSVGEGTYHKRPSGLIEHVVMIGRDKLGKAIRLKVYGKTPAECRIKMAKRIEEKQRAGGVRLASDTTIATWCAAWLARKKGKIAEATYRQYESAVRLHIEPYLGRMRMDRLSIDDGEEWLDALDESGVGGRAQQYARMVLGNALNDAMRLTILDRNVIALVRIPSHDTEEFEVWDIDQALAFLEAAKTCRYHALWVLWLTTGPRPHEMLGLRPSDVSSTEITLTKQLRRGGNERKKMKTGTSRRTLRLAPIATEALAQHRERIMAEGLRASAWVFPRPSGEATVYRTLVKDHYEEIVARASYIGVDGNEQPLPRIRPYDLRHTYATLALKAGVPIKVVSETLGHESIEITLRTYAHVLASMREEHVVKIQELFAPRGVIRGVIEGVSTA